MIIAFNCGHTAIKGGAGYGAVGKLNEVTEDRAVGTMVMDKLRGMGHTVIDCTVDNAISQQAYLDKACQLANNSLSTLFVSLHYNAGGGNGTEIFTYKNENVPQAKNVLNNLVNLGFRNRGIKDGSGLYVIRNTKMTAMLIEVCFVDNDIDYNKYKAIGRRKVAQAIADGIAGAVRKEDNMTYAEAITILTKKGVVTTPDYWNNAVKCVNNLEQLIINMAKALG